MRHQLLKARYYLGPMLATVVFLAGCGARPTVTLAPTVSEPKRTDQPAATYTAYPTYTPYPTFTPLPTAAPTRTPTPASAVAPSETATVGPTSEPTGIPTESPASPPPQPASGGPSTATNASSLGITRLQETSPGPPFTVQVDAIRVEDGRYRVTGVVRNDGSETYEGVGIHATFYTLGPSGQGSGEDGLYPHGPVDAYCPCPFLEPGGQCPYSVEIYERNYAAYGLHPYGQPVAFHLWHEPASVTVSHVSVSNDGIGNVRISGTVTNRNDFTVKRATIAGVLVDSDGRVVSEGSTVVLGGIEPGASALFDLRVAYQPYARYELYVQGVRY